VTAQTVETRFFEGEAFLCCGCVVLMTSHAIYTIEDDEFAGRIVGLLRDSGIREPTKRDATVAVEIEAVETVSARFEPAGFNYLAHSERTVSYDVRLMTVRKGGKLFFASDDVCRELAQAEQIREEF
jgi:hypothetical protein